MEAGVSGEGSAGREPVGKARLNRLVTEGRRRPAGRQGPLAFAQTHLSADRPVSPLAS